MIAPGLRRRVPALALAAAGLTALVLGPGSASATFPGGNGPIVFTSTRDGNPEIYRMNPDGTGQTRLTNSPGADTDPVWSADRTRIAFVSTRDGNPEIYTIGPNGQAPNRVTVNSAADTDPAWMPNGNAIVFASDRDGDREIYRVTADGAVTTKLTNNAAQDFAPDVSADGTKIAFQRFTGGTGTGTGDEIYVMNADGGSQVNLTENAGTVSDIDPSWRPDGTEIAFASNRDGDYEIFRMQADGANETQLTNSSAADVEPAFSPDGLLIAFTSGRAGNNEVFRMTRTGASPTNLSNNAASDSEPSWQATDITTPETTIDSGPAEGEELTTNTPTFEFSSNEPGSTFQCSLDGGAFTACTSPYTTPPLSDGPHTFAVRAIDPTGNIDPTPASRSFAVDVTVPNTTITSGPADGSTINEPTATFEFTATEPSTFECSLDGAEFSPCESPYTTPALEEGPHTFEVRAVDGFGNTDQTPAIRTFTVDLGDPDTTIDSGPEDGGLTNDPTPTFGFSSDELDSTFECSVDGSAFQPCTSPYTTPPLSDGEHTFAVRATDAGGNVDDTPASRTFTVDQTPSDTQIVAGPADGSTVEEREVTFLLDSPDDGATFECSIDSGPFTPCEPFYVTPELDDGQHTFAARSVDDAGNPDPTPATRTFTVEAPPRTTITSGPAGGSRTPDNTPTFEFTSDENDSVFECSLDGSAFQTCESPYTTQPLSDGDHTFVVRAVDPNGRPDPAPEERTFTVDTTAPETQIDSGPAEGSTSNDNTPTFTFSSPEQAATFECSVDGGAFTSCTSPATIGPLSDGQHTFAVRAKDELGNADPTPATRTFTIDTSGPETNITFGPADGSTVETREVTFGFDSPEPVTGFECSLDGAAFTDCESPYVSPELDDGQHTFAVRAVDADGFADTTPASRTFTVDAPPRTTITNGPADGSTIADDTPTFEFASDENDSTFECSVDGSAYEPCSSPFTTEALSDGTHNFSVRAVDPQDRADPSPASRSFTTDTTGPETSIDSGPAEGSTTTDPTPAFGFSSPEDGATFECSLDGGAYEPCTSPEETGPLGDGPHTFSVRAIDSLGNRDATPATRSFTVDTTAPETSIDSGPADGSFTNDNTPTFTFSSPDGTATFECSIDGGAFQACASPFTAPALSNGQHTFTVRAVDPQGIADPTPASRTFTVDTVAPQTTILSGPIGRTSDASPTFTFSSSQANSTFECSVDGGAFTACTSPYTTGTLADGAHTFAVRATDPAGNTDATPATRSFTVDTADPETTITGGPDEGSTVDDNTPTFTFDSSDPNSTFECSIDGGAFAPCTSPYTPSALGDGPHTFEVRAIDPAGNVDPTPASRSFTVDVFPETQITSGPADGATTGDSTPTFEFASSENDSTFECSVDGSDFEACTSPFTTPELGEGSHTFSVRAVDPQDRADPTPATRTFNVDLTGPETQIDSGPAEDSTSNDNTPTFTFSSPEQGANFECSVDGGTFEPCSSPHTPTALGDGQHTFAVRAVDASGNPDPTPASRTFNVDTSGPETNITFGPAEGSTTEEDEVTFGFASPEPVQGFECSIDGGPFQDCDSPYVTPELSDGSHTFAVRAVDADGFADSTPATRTFNVDAPPQTTITSGPADGSTTDDDTPTFEFASDENDSFFECSVDGSVFQVCDSPYTMGPLADGQHTFVVRAVDPGSRPDPTPAERTFTVDTSAPFAAPQSFQSAEMTEAGFVPVGVTCSGDEACAGTLILQTAGERAGAAKAGRRVIRLGRASYRIGAGKAKTVRVKLTRRARRLVEARGEIKAVAIAQGRGYRKTRKLEVSE